MSTPADFIPLRTLSSFAQDYPQLAFIIEQFINKVITIVPVSVVSVQNSGSLTSDCYVTVQPLLKQRLENGTGSDHGEIANVPCFRLRSGGAAVILDPVAGDVGLMLVAYRDSSSLVAQDEAAPGSLQGGSSLFNPGSAAKYDWGSGFYLGGWMNGDISAYFQLTASLCKIVAPTINLNGAIISSAGEVTDGAGIVLGTHTHPGTGTLVAPSGGGPVSGDTGAPI